MKHRCVATMKGLSCLLAIAWVFQAENAPGAYLDDIGYTALVQQLQSSGTTVPTGAGVSVTQVEATSGTTSISGTTYYQYLPTAGSYSGVTFTLSSTATYPGLPSGHADMVGQLIYGNVSMGNGISQVAVYNANDWIGSGFLNYGSTAAPKTETRDVVNNSWVGTTGNAANDANILRRLDYSIQQDDYVTVVGIQNSGGGATPNLLSGAYNVISAGVTDGTHMSGSSSLNAGVTYPHLVVPVGTTSEATAVISSAAALLIQTARATPALATNGAKSETVKAILLAGATKEEIPSWSHTSTQPLDTTYGAGELNIQLSDNILTAGEQTPSVNPAALVGTTGWDYNTLSLNQTVSYYFDLSGTGDISIALTWNAAYATGTPPNNYNTLTASLANLNLSLYEVQENGSLGNLVATSVAASGNIEYIWATDLSAGSYVIQVAYAGNTIGSLGSQEYAAAWQTTLTVPEPSAAIPVLTGVLALAARRRERPLPLA